jgi:hypothetical protein
MTISKTEIDISNSNIYNARTKQILYNVEMI